ncbi:unknown protein [Seminavis robusta]|uniref:DDE Tnp4 domain-containing protein n=1 Tax=Seminavis robusta TaxID=568900 RepID=A0A9N8DKL7_9STRA|nr:unknown protein [Seminavis robusta]|eukprot:Sro134_g063501.1  (413) ;mRNA; r:61506-62744
MDHEYEQDAALLLQLFILSVGLLLCLPGEPRNPSFFEQRLAWKRYSEKHQKRSTFTRRLRMGKDSFDKLLSFIVDDLLVNETQAVRRGGSIIPALCLYCTLRYLAGGSYLDITDIAGISKSSFYRVLWKTITAICKCPQLKIRFPNTGQEIKDAIDGFAGISDGGAISNCVGVVDGYLMRIKVPTKKETGNIRSFFSGHYQCYGVNIQAVADHHSRFIFFAYAAPGVSDDRNAMRQCALHGLVESLPAGACVIGDAAYIPTERMVPIYQGTDKLIPLYDNFNFYASQCRIRVEMAFGIMQMKWGILARPLGCSLKNMLWLAQAIARLHNFCINERLEAAGTVDNDTVLSTNGTGYIPSVPHDADGDPVRLDNIFKGSFEGNSYLREFMAKRIKGLQLQRPSRNKKRRRREDE